MSEFRESPKNIEALISEGNTQARELLQLMIRGNQSERVVELKRQLTEIKDQLVPHTKTVEFEADMHEKVVKLIGLIEFLEQMNV